MSRNRSERTQHLSPPGGEPYTDETRAMARPGSSARRPQPRPRRNLWAQVRLALIAAVALALIGIALLYWQVSSLADAITVSDVRNNAPIASPLIGANVLIIGTDERAGRPEEGVRGDTLILARLDAAGRWASLLSIPRDSQVSIPRVDLAETKINVAYGQGHAQAEALYGPGATPQQGGMALAAQTVEEFLGLRERGMKVDFVAVVNFAGFAGLIDALGGVMIDVPVYILDEEYPTEDFGIQRVEFQPGPQRMDGKTALIYARTRHQDSDFGRAERQQQVVRAILQEFRAKGPLGQALLLPTLLRSVSGEEGAPRPVLTTMPIDRVDVLLGLMGLAAGLDPDALGQFRLGPDQLAFENGSNLIFEPQALQALLDQWQRPPSEAAEDALVQVFNGTDTAGLARQVSITVEGAGFRVLPPDNAPAPTDRTRIFHQGGAPATGRRLARTLNAELVDGPPPNGLISEANLVVVLGPEAARP